MLNLQTCQNIPQAVTVTACGTQALPVHTVTAGPAGQGSRDSEGTIQLVAAMTRGQRHYIHPAGFFKTPSGNFKLAI